MKSEAVNGAKIVVIGGGTGSFAVLSGLKNYATDITALVNMADDGGSTGQLRDEMGVLPPGDVRQCLVALSRSPKVRDLFNYRFSEGNLAGHAFGNLFLAALEDMTGDFVNAVDLAEEILNVEGHVVPVTLDQVTICIDHGGKEILRHERNIDGMHFVNKHPKLWLEPEPKVNEEAIYAIMNADVVVVASGDIYKSIGPSLVVSGVGEALQKTPAKKIYVSNLINKPGQTDSFGVSDYANELERLAGGEFLDYVLYNSNRPSKALLEKYAKAGELPVEVDSSKLKDAHFKARGISMLANEIWQNTNKKDPLASQRTLIRHDPDAVARAIMKIYFS